MFTTALVILLTSMSLSGAPPIISSAASQAGVAVAAGEEAKENQYLDIVNESGDDFIPLVCESFGTICSFNPVYSSLQIYC